MLFVAVYVMEKVLCWFLCVFILIMSLSSHVFLSVVCLIDNYLSGVLLASGAQV